jgi:hypothetical protein
MTVRNNTGTVSEKEAVRKNKRLRGVSGCGEEYKMRQRGVRKN